MPGKLFEQVPPIPAIAKLIQVALYVHFAEMMICALEEAFGVGNGQVDAAQLPVLLFYGYVLHFNVMAELHNDVVASPSITAKPLSRRVCLHFLGNYRLEIGVLIAVYDLHD